jgi:pSer/pThr/pTyr-binding forkhead associated (FHA) protein
MESSSIVASAYRLRGRVRDGERTFDLNLGEHSVGSSRTSDVDLPVRGVSRQHAVLVVTRGGLVVEDRGSTNGSYVNGHRVERSSVPVGARLRFGPVLLEVEAVEAEDVEVGIALPAVAAAASAITPESTTRISWETGAEHASAPAEHPSERPEP